MKRLDCPGAFKGTEMNTKPISVTIPDAVAITGIGRTRLYGLIKKGKLTPRKHGSRTLLLVDELESYVRSLPAGQGGA